MARFTWNWALAQWKKQYEAGKKPNGLDLKKQFNAIKPMEFPWTYHVTKYASQQPFIFLQNRIFRCGDCGLEIDRDLNAAINLFSTVSSTGFQACGEDGSGLKTTLSETGLSEAGTKPCADLYTF